MGLDAHIYAAYGWGGQSRFFTRFYPQHFIFISMPGQHIANNLANLILTVLHLPVRSYSPEFVDHIPIRSSENLRRAASAGGIPLKN